MPTEHTITIDGTGYSVGDGDSLLVNSTGSYNSTTSTQIFTFTPTTGRFRGFNTSSGQTTPSSNYEIGDTFTATQNLTLYSVEQLPTVTYDLDNLELSVGTHTITAKAKASGFTDSVASNSKTYLVAPATNPYLTFSSPTSFTIAKHANATNDGTVQYSTDKTTWSTFTTTAVTSVLNGSNYEVYFRGIGNTYVNGDYSFFVITGSNVSCNGNIETLLDYATVDAGNHPTMADFCYKNMFRGCTSLTTAPTIPATTLTNYCYFNMFNNCTSLTSAPSLPATTLTDDCYYYMFYNCTSLTSAPALHATTLADKCYSSMFEGCTSLKLSATQTGNYIIPYRIPTSGTGTVSYQSLVDMFSNTGGAFTGTPTINTTYYLWSE